MPANLAKCRRTNQTISPLLLSQLNGPLLVMMLPLSLLIQTSLGRSFASANQRRIGAPGFLGKASFVRRGVVPGMAWLWALAVANVTSSSTVGLDGALVVDAAENNGLKKSSKPK